VLAARTPRAATTPMASACLRRCCSGGSRGAAGMAYMRVSCSAPPLRSTMSGLMSPAQHLAAVLAEFRGVGFLGKAGNGRAHGAVALAAQHVEGALGVDPVALGLVPVGLAHVLHIDGAYLAHLLAGEQGENISTVSQKKSGLPGPRSGSAPWGRGSRPAACRRGRNWCCGRSPPAPAVLLGGLSLQPVSRRVDRRQGGGPARRRGAGISSFESPDGHGQRPTIQAA
jgi:hypothetical protein